MSDDQTLLSEITLNGKPINQCEMVLECDGGHYRLYVDKQPEHDHFYAMAVEFVECGCGGGSIWDQPDIMVRQLFQVSASFDGVRHLGFNPDAGEVAGYMHCPNMQGLITLFQKVREIEKEICRDCDSDNI